MTHADRPDTIGDGWESFGLSADPGPARGYLALLPQAPTGAAFPPVRYPTPPRAVEVLHGAVSCHAERLYLEGVPALTGFHPDPETVDAAEVPLRAAWAVMVRRGWAPAVVLRAAVRAWRRDHHTPVPPAAWVWSASRLRTAPAPEEDGFAGIDPGEVAREAWTRWEAARAALRPGVTGAELRRVLGDWEDLLRRAPRYAAARTEALREAALRGAWVWPSLTSGP